VEVRAPAWINGEAVAAETYASLQPGDELCFGGVGLTVRTGGVGSEGTTRLTSGFVAPNEVRLYFHARGGLLKVVTGARSVAVHLSDRRCDLVAALLRPSSEHEPGDFISDDELAPRIWGRTTDKGRTDINILLHRTRRVLLDAGVDGPALLKRAVGGGETRFVMAAKARVEVS
jgi:hypothetical protein